MKSYLIGSKTVAPIDSIKFQYWIILLSLMKKGIPYDALLQLSDGEMCTVLAVQSALDENEQEEAERIQRLQEHRMRTK